MFPVSSFVDVIGTYVRDGRLFGCFLFLLHIVEGNGNLQANEQTRTVQASIGDEALDIRRLKYLWRVTYHLVEDVGGPFQLGLVEDSADVLFGDKLLVFLAGLHDPGLLEEDGNNTVDDN